MFTKVERNFFYRGLIPCSIKILRSVHPPHLSRVLKIWDSVAGRRPFSACNKGNRRRLHAGKDSVAVVVVVVVVVIVVVVAVAVVVVVLVVVAVVEVVVVVVVVAVVVVVVVVIIMVKKLLYFHDRIIIQYCKSMAITIKI